MIGYASRTGTRRNLRGLAAANWRLLVSAKGVLRTEGFPYALDNGAWWAFSNNQPFDEVAFLKAFELLGAGADFVVLPDIVAGGQASLDFSLTWRERLGAGPLYLLAVQDGMTVGQIRPLLGDRLGVFVGGSTEWKISTMSAWGALAIERGVWCHVGRVNSARRIRMCHAAGATSFDGSGPSRFATVLPGLDAARQQPDLLAGMI